MSTPAGGAAMTGFSGALVQVDRSGEPTATQGSSRSAVPPEYTRVGVPPSFTSTPDQQPSASGPAEGSRATGRSVQVTRSVLVAWPHWMRWWKAPSGLYW